MGPKKKERDLDLTSSSNKGTISNNGRVDPVQADRELFLQAFEKPTQIYRYLRSRHLFSPVFLHRTLSYMKGRCKRNNQARKTFKVDDFLQIKTNKNLNIDAPSRSKFLTLIFLGFHDATKVNECHESVRVETQLQQIGHKKRKEVSSPIMRITIGSSEVCVNPSDESPPSTAPTVSIATDDLSQPGTSYVLLLRVTAPLSLNNEPLPKRRRLSEISSQTAASEEAVRLYGAELFVSDRNNRLLLINGDYELVMNEIIATEVNGKTTPVGIPEKSPRKPSCSWGTLESTSSSEFSHGPVLKFRLQWSDNKAAAWVDRPQPFASTAPQGNEKSTRNSSSSSSINGDKTIVNGSEEESVIVRYQFLYNASRRQQTETRLDFRCPWCSLLCLQLPSLLKHLRLCHSRFIFSHVEKGGMEKGHVRIDISVNDSYDGSYSGNPHDLIVQPMALSATGGGAAFGRQGPSHRTPITAILIWRPHRLRSNGHDPLHMETDDAYEVCETQRPFITGHNRLYHHTSTCLPIQAKELDVDSENESDPEWLRVKTCRMIDEFTDVNEGEKELMKMWNLHVLKHNYVGDCQMGLALQMFLDTHGLELLKKNLYRNFILHLNNLYDFGIITPATVLRTIGYLQLMLQRSPEHQDILKQAWRAQLDN